MNQEPLPRRQRPAARLAALMLSYPPGARMYGYPMSSTARVRPARMYPILDRWLKLGWLMDGWDESSPPRRFYVVSDDARKMLGQVARGAPDDQS